MPSCAALRAFPLWAVVIASGCHAASSDAPSPAPVESRPATAEPARTKVREDAVKIRGTVETIRMHNINKALGHYTFNVEIELRHEGVQRAGELDPSKVPNPLTVRVDKVFWSEMSQAERDAVAPDGPDQALTPARWKDLEVGDVVDLEVTFTSPALAHRVR